MITKRRLQQYISEIDGLISTATTGPNWYIKDPASLLTETILRLGFQPRLRPSLQFYKVVQECTNGTLDLEHSMLRSAYLNDLKNIRAMLEGISHNRWRYNLSCLSKIIPQVLSLGEIVLKGIKGAC